MLPLCAWFIFKCTFWKQQEREEMNRCGEVHYNVVFSKFLENGKMQTEVVAVWVTACDG